jgi:hypothetical protein
MQELSTTTAEGMCAIWPRIKANIHQVVPEQVQKLAWFLFITNKALEEAQ